MAAKTPLLLLPGLLCDRALWEPQLAGLSEIADMTVGEIIRPGVVTKTRAALLQAVNNWRY